MKKIFFLLAFAFIGTQAYSQVYMLIVEHKDNNECSSGDLSIRKIEPTGVETSICIDNEDISQLNIEINNIINLGYKLIQAPNSEDILYNNFSGDVGTISRLYDGPFVYFFAIP